jgi:hypothetical protein
MAIILSVAGAVISIAVMFQSTKDGDVSLRAGLLLLVGVAFWVLDVVALRRD